MTLTRAIPSILVCLALAVACGDNNRGPGGDVDAPPGTVDASLIDAGPPDADTAGVLCGDVTCDPGMDCCVEQGAGGSTCVAAGTCGGTAFTCDDITDCATAGDVCCYGMDGSTCVAAAECQTPTCVGNDDCTDAQNDTCCAVAGVMVCARMCP